MDSPNLFARNKNVNFSERDAQRFWQKVDRCGPDDCWEWTSERNKQGYGQFWLNGKSVLAHRVSLKMANPELDLTGLLACHACDHPPCVNPAHLFAGDVHRKHFGFICQGANAPSVFDKMRAAGTYEA